MKGFRGLASGLAISAVAALGATATAGAAHASGQATARVVQSPPAGAKPYDFNGDGHPDLALASPYGTVGGSAEAGFVTIVDGSGSGADTTRKQVFSQGTAGVPGAVESGDHFGYSIASFDYDRDGYADLLVGAPDEDTTDGTDAGSEWILWGSPSGLTGTGSSAINEPADPASGAGPGPGHRFGFTLVAGDFDGDGWTDWADTAPGEPFFWLLSSAPGTALKASKTFAPTARRKALRGTRRRAAAAAGTGFDALVPAAGDVNGDHRTDLVMGWRNPAATDPAQRYGFDVWTDVSAADPAADVLARVDGLAVGDFNGDGFGDVAAGAADGSAPEGNHVTIFKGDASGAMTDSYSLNEDTPGVPGTRIADDKFGNALSAGDVNKDGKADLAVGVPARDVSGNDQAGEVIMLYGSADGLTGTGSQAFSQDTAGVPGTAETLDRLGWSVSLLDITADGYADLIGGAPMENSKDGAVSVLKGTADVLTTSGAATFGAGTLGVTGRDAQIGVRIGRVG